MSLDINEFQEVWSTQEVEDIQNWMKEDGSKLFVEQQFKAQIQSETINSLTQVNAEILKAPFTFNL